MKRHRNNNSNGINHLDHLEKFNDKDTNNNGQPSMMHSHNSSSSSSSIMNKEGGMSRAAKKRAKKRAKTAAASAKSNNNVLKSGDTAVEDTTIKDATSNKKLKIPLDDNADDLLHAANNSIDKKKKKKKKSKKDKHHLNEDAEVNAFAIGDAAIVKTSKMEVDDDDNQVKDGIDDDVDDGDDDEMGPELEALLSTLTPMQILLLKRHNEDSDEDMKMPATSQMQSIDGIDSKEEEQDDEEVQDNINEEGALAGINPIQIIGDLTTQHRAKILLSSIISPSGVTTSEFYDSYWGKKPLLVCLEDDEDNDGVVNGSVKENSTEQNLQNEELALQHATRLNGFLDRSIIDTMISRNKLRYGLDLNVTRFTDTMGNGLRHRITLDPEPKRRKNKGSAGDDVEYIVANPKDVWTNVDTSHCTVRLLRPHEHNDNIHSMLSLLESEFGCMVGSNAYLTPLNSQGFAPHYDDVDVFILQLEGYKRWRVYAPFNKRETLPRQSSRDYTEKEIEENGDEVLDVVLSPGDVLYLPRGWIHQAETVSRPSHMPKLTGIKDDHSLHLTVSAMQNWCWADFLEMLMPEALEGAATSDKSTSLREGLPRNFLSYMGTMHQVDNEEGIGGDLPEGLKQVAEAQSMGEDEMDQEEAQIKQRTLARQTHFKSEAKKRIMRVCKQAMSMLDDACDQIGKRFLSDRLPPALLEPERCLTKEALSDNTAAHHHDAAKKIWPNTLCRLARPGIARLVMEDDKAVLYHCLDNSRVYHGTPLSPMEFEIDDAPALEQLLTTVEPHWIQVSDLIHGDIEDKMEIAQALFDEGILATLLTDTPDRSVQTG